MGASVYLPALRAFRWRSRLRRPRWPGAVQEPISRALW